MIEPEQLDLFFDPPLRTVTLPPCGRGLGRCVAIIERDQIRCLACGATGSGPMRPTFLDNFIRSQQAQLEFLHQQDRAGVSGIKGDERSP